MTLDPINALFESGGACLLLLNIRALLRDKSVRGVHWAPLAFWTAWGFWNLRYYSAIGHWWSFAGGVAIVMCNCVQLGLMGRYWRR